MDFHKLGTEASKSDTIERKIVAGRVLQLDADFACYEVSDLEEPLSKSFSRLLSHIEFKRKLAGAEFVNAHITLGQKTGRERMATVKEYQQNRDPDAPIKVRVRELRHKLADYKPTELNQLRLRVIQHPMYEADDVLVRVQHEQIKRFGWDSSVIMSGDKDLWMCQGWHCDSKSGRLWLVKGYGHTEYREVGNTKPKLVGEGRSWFWHQMVMGDKADNIPGLPKMDNRTVDVISPLKSGKPRGAGSMTCGEAKAVALLENVTLDKVAAHLVLLAYEAYYNVAHTQGFAHERFMEQAYLLWMQRNRNPYDVEKYLQDTCKLKVRFTKNQRRIIDKFIEDRDLVELNANQEFV